MQLNSMVMSVAKHIPAGYILSLSLDVNIAGNMSKYLKYHKKYPHNIKKTDWCLYYSAKVLALGQVELVWEDQLLTRGPAFDLLYLCISNGWLYVMGISSVRSTWLFVAHYCEFCMLRLLHWSIYYPYLCPFIYSFSYLSFIFLKSLQLLFSNNTCYCKNTNHQSLTVVTHLGIVDKREKSIFTCLEHKQ